MLLLLRMPAGPYVPPVAPVVVGAQGIYIAGGRENLQQSTRNNLQSAVRVNIQSAKRK